MDRELERHRHRPAADPNVRAADWAAGRRIPQYRGGHTDDYGHTSLEIDTDYVDAQVAGTVGTTTGPTPTPVATVVPGPDGSIAVHAVWAGEPGITSWQLLAGDSPTSLAPVRAQERRRPAPRDHDPQPIRVLPGAGAVGWHAA